MSDTTQLDYERIATAIDYITLHFKDQPSLEEIATVIGLSSFHFQRLFTKWAGVSPKKFIQYLSLEYAKTLLIHSNATLLDASYETGLSSSSRLHDLFINIEGMSPGEYKDGGKNLNINYSYSQTPFGSIIVASTTKGICHMAFEEEGAQAFHNLTSSFPNATYQEISDEFQQRALSIFKLDWKNIDPVKLHIKGTDFQLKIWAALLKLPIASLASYGVIADKIDQPKAHRAVGTAIGNNPVAFLIPCHRVIQKSGDIGGYRWGSARKSAIIGWEASKLFK